MDKLNANRCSLGRVLVLEDKKGGLRASARFRRCKCSVAAPKAFKRFFERACSGPITTTAASLPTVVDWGGAALLPAYAQQTALLVYAIGRLYKVNSETFVTNCTYPLR